MNMNGHKAESASMVAGEKEAFARHLQELLNKGPTVLVVGDASENAISYLSRQLFGGRKPNRYPIGVTIEKDIEEIRDWILTSTAKEAFRGIKFPGWETKLFGTRGSGSVTRGSGDPNTGPPGPSDLSTGGSNHEIGSGGGTTISGEAPTKQQHSHENAGSLSVETSVRTEPAMPPDCLPVPTIDPTKSDPETEDLSDMEMDLYQLVGAIVAEADEIKSEYPMSPRSIRVGLTEFELLVEHYKTPLVKGFVDALSDFTGRYPAYTHTIYESPRLEQDELGGSIPDPIRSAFDMIWGVTEDSGDIPYKVRLETPDGDFKTSWMKAGFHR